MYIRVHVKPDSKKESVTRESETELYIAVKEKAERNMANKRVVTLLSGEYNVSTSDIRLVTGHHSPTKMFNISI